MGDRAVFVVMCELTPLFFWTPRTQQGSAGEHLPRREPHPSYFSGLSETYRCSISSTLDACAAKPRNAALMLGTW